MNSLLSWLSEAIGGGGNSMPYSMQGASLPPPQMPPVQMTGQDAPFPPAGDPMTAGGVPSNGPGLPYPTGTDPMTAGGVPPGGPPLPPMNMNFSARRITEPPMPPGPGNGTNGVGPGMGVATPADIGAGPQARTILGRAIGLDPNQESKLTGSLAAGLKSVGENMHKPGLAAASGSAGSALEGGQRRDDTTFDQQGRVIDRATRAKAEDTRAKSYGVADQLARARTELVTEQTKMAKSGGAASVMNSQQQLYLRAMGLVNGDPEVKLAKSTYDNAIKLGDQNSPEVKAAKKAHEDLVKAKTAAHLQSLGVDPKLADKLGKQPGVSQENPMPSKSMTQQQLDALPPGTWVMGPNGKPLQKKGPAPAAAGPNQPAPAQSMTPQAVQPPLPPVARNAMATMEADEEDD